MTDRLFLGRCGALTLVRQLIVPLLLVVEPGTCAIYGGEVKEPAETSLRDIEAVYRERELAVPAFAARWEDERTQFAHTLSDPGPGTTPYPPQDMTYSVSCSLAVAGSNFKFIQHGLQYSGTVHRFILMDRVGSFNGGVDRTLYGYVPEGDVSEVTSSTAPTGFEAGRDRSSEADDPNSWVAFTFFRPLDSQFRPIAFGNYKIDARPGRIGGVNCLRLVPSSGGALWSVNYWVDPASQFAIRRIESLTAGTVTFQIDIEYSPHDLLGVAPSRWSAQVFASDQTLLSQCISTITSIDISKTPDNVDTSFDFPSGTMVRSKLTGTDEFFLVRADASQRPVTRAERLQSTAYQTLLRTEPDEGVGLAAGQEARRSRTAVLVLNVAAGLVVAWFTFRFVRRRYAPR